MALTAAELIIRQSLDLDYDDVIELLAKTGLKGDDLETLALDWTQKQTNINDIASESTTNIQTETNNTNQIISTVAGLNQARAKSLEIDKALSSVSQLLGVVRQLQAKIISQDKKINNLEQRMATNVNGAKMINLQKQIDNLRSLIHGH